MGDGVLIFGATRGTGRAAAEQLRARGDAVSALVRAQSDASELEALGVSIYRGDVLNAEDVAQAYASTQPSAALVSLGGKRGEDAPRPDLDGVRVITSAAQVAGVPRIIMITAIGCGDSRSAVAPRVIEVLGEILALKTEAEDLLQASGLDWTILRPGGMTSDPASGTGIMTEDHGVMGVINREDLATLAIRCLDDTQTVGRIYHTIDPGITWEAPLQRGGDLGERKP
jgi:uncharacterized protein YbjT (DUF2867 family)